MRYRVGGAGKHSHNTQGSRPKLGVQGLERWLPFAQFQPLLQRPTDMTLMHTCIFSIYLSAIRAANVPHQYTVFCILCVSPSLAFDHYSGTWFLSPTCQKPSCCYLAVASLGAPTKETPTYRSVSWRLTLMAWGFIQLNPLSNYPV